MTNPPTDEIERVARCTMGVGCNEAGVCYAEAMDEPERCPASTVERIAVGNVRCCHLPDYLALVPRAALTNTQAVGGE
jgi:hypothetical protein